MKELMLDVEQLILQHPRLEYVKRAGGVLKLRAMEEFPLQQKTPCLVLTDGGAADILHWSSRKRWMPFLLVIHAVEQVMEREGAIVGTKVEKGVEQLAVDTRFVVDMNRIGGKYARCLLRGDAEPTLLTVGNIYLLEKALTFEYVRIE